MFADAEYSEHFLDEPIGVEPGPVEVSRGSKEVPSSPYRILVEDEATSALDNQTGARVTAAIGSLDAGATKTGIDHRLPTIQHSNRIFFIREGNLAAAEHSQNSSSRSPTSPGTLSWRVSHSLESSTAE